MKIPGAGMSGSLASPGEEGMNLLWSMFNNLAQSRHFLIY